MNSFELSVTSGVLILAVLLVRAVGKKRLPMRTFTVLWHVALLRLFLPVELPSPISAASIGRKLIRWWRQADLWKRTVTPDAVSASSVPSIPQDPVLSGSACGTFLFEYGFSDAYPVSGAPSAEDFVSSARFAPDWRLIVWIAGAVCILTVFTVLYVRALKRFRQSLPLESDFARDWLATHAPRRKIEVRSSDRIDSPLTYGVLRPVILLPSDLDLSDTKRLEFVLAHELTHIRHFDALTKLLLAGAVSLHWFNPAAWVLYCFCNRDMELACDEAVVRMFGADTRRDYALMLLELVEKKNLPPLPSGANGFGQVAIRERIGAIMKVRRITWAASLAAVIAVCGITAVFATTAAQEKPEEPEVPEQTEQTDAGADSLAAEEEEQERILEEEFQAEFQTQLQAQVQAELDAQLELTPEQVPEPEIPLWERYNLTEEEFMSEKNLRFREKLEEKEARRLAEEQAGMEGELAEAERLAFTATEQAPEPEIPVWEKYGMTEESYYNDEKNQRLREKIEEKAAKDEAERGTVWPLEEWNAANEKWHGGLQLEDKIREILLTGTESWEDRLARLDALILEFRADFRYDEGLGSASLWCSDVAEGEPKWEPYADLRYESLQEYYDAFAPYGVTCEPRRGTETGDPYWNGRPVTSWEDILFSANGSSVRRYYIAEHNFTDAVSVRVVYDGETVVGLEVNPNR